MRLVGSRLPLDYARETGANFLTRRRPRGGEGPNFAQGTRAELRSPGSVGRPSLSAAMSLNLFGDLAADVEFADRAVHTWWPDAPGTVSGGQVRPLAGTSRPRLHREPERLRRGHRPRPRRRDEGGSSASSPSTTSGPSPRYRRHHRICGVTWRSRSGRAASVRAQPMGVSERSDLWEPWLTHLLLLSMLQHPDGMWTWGRCVFVHPADNSDFADACARYRQLLAEPSTFSSTDHRGSSRRKCSPECERGGISRSVPVKVSSEVDEDEHNQG